MTAAEDTLDPVARAILEALSARPTGASITGEEVAQAIAEERRRPVDPPDLWRRFLPAVRQQALHLARAGRIEFLRKGKPTDPETVRGVVRYRLAS